MSHNNRFIDFLEPLLNIYSILFWLKGVAIGCTHIGLLFFQPNNISLNILSLWLDLVNLSRLILTGILKSWSILKNQYQFILVALGVKSIIAARNIDEVICK